MSSSQIPQAAGQAPPDRSGGFVLIVDDHRDAADSLARLLNVLGRRTEVAYDAAGALAAIERCRPQLVLLDLGMPKVDGFETARRIGARQEWRDIPLVALTGSGHEQDQDRTSASGFAAHLVKPVDLVQLERMLNALVPV
jgi:YD repeat-containing protein